MAPPEVGATQMASAPNFYKFAEVICSVDYAARNSSAKFWFGPAASVAPPRCPHSTREVLVEIFRSCSMILCTAALTRYREQKIKLNLLQEIQNKNKLVLEQVESLSQQIEGIKGELKDHEAIYHKPGKGIFSRFFG